MEDIEECKIAEPALNEQITHVRANPPPKGGIKVVLRVQPENWEVPRDSFFQNNFFLLPKLVETVREFLQAGGARHLIDLYCGVGFFGIEAADVGRIVRRRGIRPAGDCGGAAKRGGTQNHQWRIHCGEGGGGFAGTAEEIFAGEDGGDSRSAAQRLLAGNVGIAAPDEAGAGDLCVVPSGDDGAGFEHFVRRTVSLNWRACSRWTCFRRRSTWSAWRICAGPKLNLPTRGSWIQLDQIRCRQKHKLTRETILSPRFLPWLLAAAMLAVYWLTLNRWVSLFNLGPRWRKVSGWMWQPEILTRSRFCVTYPFRWLPAAAIPLRVELFSAVCAALTLACWRGRWRCCRMTGRRRSASANAAIFHF